MSSGNYKDPLTGFTVLPASALKRTLAMRLTRVADKGRNIPVKLGFRPYQVALVLIAYTGGRRDSGEPYEVERIPILPVPQLADLTGVARPTTAAGADEIGTLLLSKIPQRYGERVLCGLDAQGNPPDPAQKYIVEITFQATGEDIRRAFTVASAPSYTPTAFSWAVVLERASIRDWRRPEVT